MLGLWATGWMGEAETPIPRIVSNAPAEHPFMTLYVHS